MNATRHQFLFWVYMVIALAGLVTAWVFNGIAVMTGQDYGSAWFGTAVNLVATSDLLILAIAAVLFMIVESRRLGMKRVWLYILLSGVTAMAFSFPLFLAMRERHLMRSSRPAA